jgi:hypothetical protein
MKLATYDAFTCIFMSRGIGLQQISIHVVSNNAFIHRGESRLCFIAKCSKHSYLGPGSYHTNFGDFCAPVQTGTVAQTALVVITAQLASDFVLIADVLKVNCSFLKCAEHNYLFKNLLLHASPLVLCYIYIYTFISSKESYSLKVRLVAMLD